MSRLGRHASGMKASDAVVLGRFSSLWSRLLASCKYVYVHREFLLDQSGRLFSIGDVKTGWFIIRYRRFTLDSPEIPFSMKTGISVVNLRQSGVNRGSIASQDPLAPSPKEMIVICCIHSLCFVNCMISCMFTHDITPV